MDVLRTLRHLASTVGDAGDARKFDRNHNLRAHTAKEDTWIGAVVRALILRVGQWAADPNSSLPKLTMAGLPKLT